jgi:plasmid stability protein
MASITIRRLNDTVQADLQEEAREILKAGLAGQRVPRLNLAGSIRRHIEPLGGVELAFPPREAVRRPPKLAK